MTRKKRNRLNKKMNLQEFQQYLQKEKKSLMRFENKIKGDQNVIQEELKKRQAQ